MIVIYLVLKFLGVSGGDDQIQNTNVVMEVPTQNESEPLINQLSYETNAEDDEESRVSSSSSVELYDEKLCVICYDEKRNSFFVPCGHCATCFQCAQRYTLQKIFHTLYQLHANFRRFFFLTYFLGDSY